MKKFIKNVTDNQSLGYSPATLSYKENGERIILKPGEHKETKLDGSSLAGRTVNGKKEYKRLRLVTEEELGTKPTKKNNKEVD